MASSNYESEVIRSFTTDELMSELTRRQSVDEVRERGEVSARAMDLRDTDDATIINAVRGRLRAIYGGWDNRTDYNDLVNQVQNADAVVLVIHKNSLTNNSDGSYTLSTMRYGDKEVDSIHFPGKKLCPSERFVDQPVVGGLSGVLISQDTIATAGHVVSQEDGLIATPDKVGELRFVFYFRTQDATKAVKLNSGDVYSAKSFIIQVFNPDKPEEEDYAVIRLDRPVTEEKKKKIPKIRIDGKIANQQILYMIGHPKTLPQKITDDGQVNTNTDISFCKLSFSHNLDTFPGNSGSPVFNAVTHQVEGIHRGSLSSVPHYELHDTCLVSAPSESSGDSWATRTTAFSSFLTKGQFYTSDGKGNTTLLKQHGTWGSKWKMIIPAEKFGGNDYTDLFFYNPDAGIGSFYSTDGKGGMQLLNKDNQPEWAAQKWTHIIPGKFWNNDFTGLFCYDSTSGKAVFYSTDGKGIITSRGTIVSPKNCSIIIPGKFSDSVYTDLIFYDSLNGIGKLFSSTQDSVTKNMNLKELKTFSWLKTWSIIIPGKYDNSKYTGLLFYDRSNGKGWFYSWNGSKLVALLENQLWGSRWSNIIPGIYAPTKQGDPPATPDTTDLLFYDEKTGLANFYTTNHTPEQKQTPTKPYKTAKFSFEELKVSSIWKKGWDRIVPGNFGATSYTDILLYDPEAPL